MNKLKTTSELIQVYSGIIDHIVREKTQGSYTWAGVLGNFLNEWIEMNSSEETYEALTESPTKDDRLLEQLEEKTRQALDLDDPMIIRALESMREAHGLE